MLNYNITIVKNVFYNKNVTKILFVKITLFLSPD